MKFTYHVSVLGQQSECPNVRSAATFANSVIGCDLLSEDMLYTYFSKCRPHLINKKIIGQLVQVSRTELKPSSNAPQE